MSLTNGFVRIVLLPILNFYWVVAALSITLWMHWHNTNNISKTYKLYLKGKWEAIGTHQSMKFLTAVMHFAPGDELKGDHLHDWYLHVEGIWIYAKEKLVDGKEVLDSYESQFMPLPLKPEDSSYSDLKDIIYEINDACRFL